LSGIPIQLRWLDAPKAEAFTFTQLLWRDRRHSFGCTQAINKNHTNPAFDLDLDLDLDLGLDLFVGARVNTEVFGRPFVSER